VSSTEFVEPPPRKKISGYASVVYLKRSVNDAVAIQERVTAVLRSIHKEAFADSYQKLYERFQQCVVKDGDYFEGQ
jgi:hypothetical protein